MCTRDGSICFPFGRVEDLQALDSPINHLGMTLRAKAEVEEEGSHVVQAFKDLSR